MLPVTPRGELAQDISVALSVLLVLVVFAWMARNRTLWRYAVPILTIALHTLVYYGVVIAVRAYGLFIPDAVALFSDWSAWLRFHTLVSLLLVEIFRLHASAWKGRHSSGFRN